MKPPQFVTITGLDEKTDWEEVERLSLRYPVEWGVLYSRKLSGIARRYPGPSAMSAIESLKHEMGDSLRLSVHLCGAVGREVLSATVPQDVNWDTFDRFQVNGHQEEIDYGLEGVRYVSDTVSVDPIVQWRHPFWPEDTGIMPLFDQSGGRGELPEIWPQPPMTPGYLVGYAGGMGPENVEEVIRTIDCDGEYWIDMETRVRGLDQNETDRHDFLDLVKVASVLARVYPDR